MIITNSNNEKIFNQNIANIQKGDSMPIENKIVNGQVKQGISFNISAIDGIFLRNGSDEAFIDKKLSALKNVVKNSSISNAGLETQLTSLTYFVKEVLKQQYYMMGGRNMTDYIPVVPAPDFKYKTKATQKILEYAGSRERGDGIAKMSGQVGPQKANQIAKWNYREFTNYQFLNAVGYDQNEINQAMVDLIPYDIVKDRVELNKKAFDLQFRDNIFGGNSTLEIEGFVNNSQVAEETILNPVSCTNAEFVAFVLKLLDDITAMKLASLEVKPDTLVMSEFIINGLKKPFNVGDNIDNMASYGSRLNYLTSMTGLNVIELPFVDKNAGNNFGLNNENVYKIFMYAKTPEVLQVMQPLDFTMQGFFTGDGFHFVSYGMAQFTDVIFSRIKGIKMYKHS